MNTNDKLLLAKWSCNENFWLTPDTIEPLWLANKDKIFEWRYEQLKKEAENYCAEARYSIVNSTMVLWHEQTQPAKQKAKVLLEWLRDTGQINDWTG